jgi:hypothetical protein
MLLQQLLDDFENISCMALDFPAALNGDGIAARLKPKKRAHAKKRIAPDFSPPSTDSNRKASGSPSATARNAETGVSKSAEIDLTTGTSVASRDKRRNSL